MILPAGVSAPLLNRQAALTKSCMRGRSGIQRIHTDNLVVGARGQVFAVGGETHRVDRARVVAHSCELFRFRVVGVVRVQDSFGRPYPDIAICKDSVSRASRDAASTASAVTVG